LASGAQTVSIYLLIAVGAAVGGVARYWCGGALARLAGETFPWGTLAVNILGSALLGFFATLTAPEGKLLVPASTRLMVTVGLCGGFTTFSTFSLETMALALDRQYFKAGLNVGGSVIACLIGAWCGYVLASALNQR
jgi:CrcB protein